MTGYNGIPRRFGLNGMKDVRMPSRQDRTALNTEAEVTPASAILPVSPYSRNRSLQTPGYARYHKGFLGTSLLEFMRADTETIIAIDSIIVANVTDAGANFTIQQIPRGQSTGDQFALFNEIDVRKNASMVISDAPIYLNRGDSLYAQSSIASALVMTVYARRT